MTQGLDPIAEWQALVHAQDGSGLCGALAVQMRERRLTFGERLLCPFLRPFFLSVADEQRVRHAAETLWRLGERVADAARERPELLRDLCLSDAEIALAEIDPGYGVSSTAGRADAFLLPDSLQFAEYNAESPAGPGYSQRLAELFEEGALMARFRESFAVRHDTPIAHLLQALLESYRDWGGTASPPQIAIVDFRGVPTWSEFELLRDAFAASGVPALVADPRDLEFDGRRLAAGGRPIDLVYRRVLINDIVARADDCRALVEAYRARAVCVANSLRCKIAHKKAFFAVLTDERHAGLFSREERDVIAAHVPWTRVVREHGAEDIRRRREQLVLKPNDEYGGTGVTLGWEASDADWDAAIERALAEADRGWVAQERIHVRREVFPVCAGDRASDREMLVDFAPYVFRGRVGGFLTRLSATGLANVTSGGGQVPAFVAEPVS
ncbi:MAG TPA: circularly permuted type 2 ATP-grasp protein [Vicinamibacterales bacterium]|nr:circularly permuted type 2 ATP-grasp protein [Vicinamibacterales bacterium]